MEAVILDPTRQVLASAEFARSPMVGEIIWINRSQKSLRYRVTDIEWTVHHKRPGIMSDTSLRIIVSDEPA